MSHSITHGFEASTLGRESAISSFIRERELRRAPSRLYCARASKRVGLLEFSAGDALRDRCQCLSQILTLRNRAGESARDHPFAKRPRYWSGLAERCCVC